MEYLHFKTTKKG